MKLKPIKLTIKPVDAEMANGFTHPQECLIATALKRQGHERIGVSDVDVDFYQGIGLTGRYAISKSLRKFVEKAYGGEQYPLDQPIVTKSRTFTLKPI